MLFTFLLIVQSLVAAALVGVILMQRSEGGGLGVGGSSSGFMTARGAADLLTRSTAVLGTLFVVLSIALAAIAGATRQPTTIDDIAEMDAALRQRLKTACGDAGAGVRLLYGGSVNPRNAAEIFTVSDGALVGGASLKAADFVPIIEAAAAAA